MKLPSWKVCACTGSLLIGLQSQIPSCSSNIAKSVDTSNLPTSQQTEEREKQIVAQTAQTAFSPQEVCNIAKDITVVILSADGKSQGTGILIHQKQDENGQFVYKVVTNGHVLTKARSYKIQTPDKVMHEANPIFRFGGPGRGEDDLAVLQFNWINNDYQIAKLARGLSLDIDRREQVIAAGFPIRTGTSKSSKLVCTQPGEVSVLLENQPMEGGYRIGYFSDLRKGMSGGPLLNLKGEVVGVNGRHSHPPFGGNRLYVYQDGQLVDETPLDHLIRSSWAIPMERVVRLAISKGIPISFNNSPGGQRVAEIPDTRNLPETNEQQNTWPRTTDRGPEANVTVDEYSQRPDSSSNTTDLIESRPCLAQNHPSEDKLEQLARQITVKIKIGNRQQSGILIHRNQKNPKTRYNYIVLTESVQPGEYNSNDTKGEIYTCDGMRNPVHRKRQWPLLLDGTKFYLLHFSSLKRYHVADTENYDLTKEDEDFFVAGYKEYDYDSHKNKSQIPASQISELFVFRNGKINKTVSEQEKGSSLDADNFIDIDINYIDKAMLGGPLLNSQGKVIGVNNQTSASDSTDIQTNHYLRVIPIEKYMKIVRDSFSLPESFLD